MASEYTAIMVGRSSGPCQSVADKRKTRLETRTKESNMCVFMCRAKSTAFPFFFFFECAIFRVFKKLPFPVFIFRTVFFQTGNFLPFPVFIFPSAIFRICKKKLVTGFIPQNFKGNRFGQDGIVPHIHQMRSSSVAVPARGSA